MDNSERFERPNVGEAKFRPPPRFSDLAEEIAMYTRPRRVSWLGRLVRVVAGVLGRSRGANTDPFFPDENEDGGALVLVASPRGPSPLRRGAAAKPPKVKSKRVQPYPTRKLA